MFRVRKVCVFNKCQYTRYKMFFLGNPTNKTYIIYYVYKYISICHYVALFCKLITCLRIHHVLGKLKYCNVFSMHAP